MQDEKRIKRECDLEAAILGAIASCPNDAEAATAKVMAILDLGNCSGYRVAGLISGELSACDGYCGDYDR